MSAMTLKHLFKSFGTQTKPPPPLPCVKREAIISDESNGERSDEDGQRNDLDSSLSISPCLIVRPPFWSKCT